MCLAIPARVVDIGPDERAVVELDGMRKEVSLALIDDVRVGDYVIIHVGFALQKLDAQEAEKTLALFMEMSREVAAFEAEASPSSR
ncbi:MAG: HypC/HybG/HupF family hydrogenase formation chaperone [Rhodocyclaceae bacterium]|nr:HypC/HybG/HupF family hydrogenase formation chaperone [Rhodocyclaceae bacterium]